MRDEREDTARLLTGLADAHPQAQSLLDLAVHLLEEPDGFPPIRMETARELIEFADGLPRARGLLHRAARFITRPDPVPNACQRCGSPIKQKRLGRRRQWCSERCRSQARRDRK